ncbi:MAG TPA: hypothetical protein VNT51_09550 [Miltoncostaeaceae bacterium]|nr:hypothetical protein [Miltoncostaeaceae bacterium]
MRNLRVPRPSPAMVVASAALMVALGGGAYAQTQLARNSVGTEQLRANAVTAPKIAPNAIVSSRIRDGQVRTQDIRAGAVTRERLAVTERTVWAAVRGTDGAVLRQSGEVVRVDHLPGSGSYTVTFARAVDACAWVASTSSDATRNQAYAEVQRTGTASTTQLTVLTSRPVGGVSALSDSDFHLIIACGAPTPRPAPR